MDSGDILFAIGSIIIVFIILYYLERQLTTVFAPHKERETGLYQGGERIEATEQKYRAEDFNLTLYFMILHIIGFFASTLYILNQSGINPISWTTIGFGAIIFYTILLVRKSTEVFN